jgi:NADH-quinone oxidoreductase subunit N
MSSTLAAQLSFLQPLLPELIMVATACLVLLLDLVIKRHEILALAGISGCLAAMTVTSSTLLPAEPLPMFDGMMVIDGYGSFFKLIFYLNAILTSCASLRYMQLERTRFGEYYALLLFATAGMMLMASGTDLIVIFLGLELMTLSTYVLAGIRRHSLPSNEAALKYFLLGGFSTAFLLYGIALIYGVTGSTALSALAELQIEAVTARPWLMLPVLLLLVGFGYKIAAAPFHMWAPDVYQGAPTPVTSFLSVGAKAAAFAALGRVLATFGGDLAARLSLLLAVLAVLSMVIGNVVAIAQTNLKRMLAYSSIAHAGYALLGLVAGGASGLSSMMVYLFVYALMNIGAFAVVILLRSEGQGEELDDVQGLARSHPIAAFVLLIFMFSLTGIPPTAGFAGKLAVFMEVTRAGYTPLAVIAVVLSVVSAFFYLRVVVYMYMREPQQEVVLSGSLPAHLVLAATALAVVVAGIFPSLLVELAQGSLL